MTDTTHTTPERIWTASTEGKCHVGFDTPSLNYVNEYVRLDLSTYAAGYEAALRDAAAKFYQEDSLVGWHIAKAILALIPALTIPNSNPPVDVNETGFCEHQTGLVLMGERKADVSAGLLDGRTWDQMPTNPIQEPQP